MVNKINITRTEDCKYALEVGGNFKEIFKNGVFCSYCKGEIKPPYKDKIIFCEMTKNVFCRYCAIYKNICRHDAKRSLFPEEVGSNHIHFNVGEIIFLDD